MWIKNITWGLFLGLAVSFATQVLTWLGLGLSNWFVLATYALVVIFIYLRLKNLSQSQPQKISWGTAILTVVILILVSRYVFQTYMYIYTRYIDPEWVNNVAVTWKDMLIESGQDTDSIESTIQSFRKSYETIPMFTIEIVKYGLSQFILGMIVAAFFVFRKRK